MIQYVVPLFFLYFILISGAPSHCGDILNCELQRRMNRNILFRHVIIYISIFLFTFVLNWYTFDALQISLAKSDNGIQQNQEGSYTAGDQLLIWLAMRTVIYLIFLISTKSEFEYVSLFLFVIIVGIFSQIIVKSYASENYLLVRHKFLITSDDYGDQNDTLVITLHNIISIALVVSIVLMCFGAKKYYDRQKITHKKDWSLFKFWFGTAKCNNN